MPVMLCTILLLLAASFASTGSSGGPQWDLLNGAGFAACALYIHLSWLSASPARQPMLDAHADLALWICGFAVLHSGGLLVAEPTLLEYLEADAPPYMLAGVMALVMLLAITWASFPRARQRVWQSWPAFRSWHKWTWLLLLGAITWHVLGSGFYFDTTLARMLGLTALVLLPLCFWTDRRLLRRRPPRPGMEVRHPGIALAGLTTLVLFAVTRA